MISYEPRPLIKITPAASASDRRVQSYNYVEAVKTLPTNFPAGEINPIIRRVNPKLLGQIRSIFIAITDDQYRQLRLKQSNPAAPAVPTAPAAASTPAARSDSNQGSAAESENEVEPEPEPFVPAPSGRNSKKRGASSEASNRSKK